MENTSKNPYCLFTADILDSWKQSDVKYVKVVELETDLSVKFFELIPNSEIQDSEEMIYNIHSEDLFELLEDNANMKFLVHEIYLEE